MADRSLDITALYGTMAPRLRAYFERRLFPRDRHLAEDLTQDVFERLIPRASRYVDDGRVEHLLYTIASTIFTDYQRRRASRVTPYSLDLGVEYPSREAAQALRVVDDRMLLSSCTLSPLQAAVVDARYAYGDTSPQAAARLGTTLEAVKQLQKRSLRSLRKQLERVA